MTREYVRRNVGFPVRCDATRSRTELGVRYRPAQKSLEAMVEQMLPRRRQTVCSGECPQWLPRPGRTDRTGTVPAELERAWCWMETRGRAVVLESEGAAYALPTMSTSS